MTGDIFEIIDFYEFGELPIDPEHGHVARLDEMLKKADLALVQGYNEDGGYYLVRRKKLNDD